MVNLICTKYGSLYNSDYVNNLYESLQKNVSVKFQFWCRTDDAKNITRNVNIITIDNLEPIKNRYEKISLLKHQTFEGTCVSFDLDMIITSDITHYVSHISDKLTLLYSHFKNKQEVIDKNKRRKVFKDCMVNSSVFSWEANSNNAKEIVSRHESKTIDSHLGSFDRFLYWDCSDLISVFPFDDYCVYRQTGLDENKSFCLFNQRPKIHEVDDPIVSKYWNFIK